MFDNIQDKNLFTKIFVHQICKLYLAKMAKFDPHGKKDHNMVGVGVYQEKIEKLVHWSKLELIWFIGWGFMTI